MKVNNSEKLIWKHKSIPINYLVGILVGSSPCIIFFQVIIIGIMRNYVGFYDILFIVIIIPVSLALPLYLLHKWGKYFFILKMRGSKFFIKPKLLAFTKRFDLSEIKSIEFLLTRTRLSYRPSIIGSDNNLFHIHITINIIDSLGETHIFNIIRVYEYKTTIDTPFIEKRSAMTSKFINDLKDLKYLLPNLISIRDEIQEELEIDII